MRSFGTENRPCSNPVAPRDDVYEYIIFKAADIKDLIVCETPKVLNCGKGFFVYLRLRIIRIPGDGSERGPAIRPSDSVGVWPLRARERSGPRDTRRTRRRRHSHLGGLLSLRNAPEQSRRIRRNEQSV